MAAKPPPAADDKGIPNYVPLVGFDENDEPFIVRTQVVKQSPVPFWLTLLIVIMMGGTIAQVVYDQVTRTQAQSCQLGKDRAIVQAIQRRAELSDQDRNALKTLITDVSKATKPSDVRTAFDKFFGQEKVTTEAITVEKQLIQHLIEERCGA